MEEVLIKSERFDHSNMARVFRNGVRELKKLTENAKSDPFAIENVNRALSKSTNNEVADMEKNVSWLATTASATPFIGLFGTVWGIMNSFRSLSSMTQATIAHVAPGIAEALIATAMGLFAAIPAVVAYNRYASRTDQLATRFESFMEEISNILQRRAAA